MSPCGANATCNYTEGSFICTCDTGFTGDGYMCNGVWNSNFFHGLKIIYQFYGKFIFIQTTTDGKYETIYKYGIKYIITLDFKLLIDTNECTSMSPCHANATCNNTDGSYICTCDPGYTGDGKICNGMWNTNFFHGIKIIYQFFESLYLSKLQLMRNIRQRTSAESNKLSHWIFNLF